jgi:hypothetical protein
VISALKYGLPLPHDSLLHIAFNFDRTSNLVGPHRAAARRHFLASTGICAIPTPILVAENIGAGTIGGVGFELMVWSTHTEASSKEPQDCSETTGIAGHWSVTVGAFGASFGHRIAPPRRRVCRDGAPVVAVMMLQQPEPSHGQNAIPQNFISISGGTAARKISVPCVDQDRQGCTRQEE